MKKFSLSNLLLIMVVAALCLSQFVLYRKLSDARAEVENIRRKYGYIRVEDDKLTYVARLAEHDNAYRIIVPAGSRYMLHLTDTTFDDLGLSTDPTPTKTISLNGWRNGADEVLSYSIQWENNVPRLEVHTQAESYFNYIPPDWDASFDPADGSHFSEGSHLDADPQKSFATDETIHLMWWRDPHTQRGLMLWLEPHATWEAKRQQK